MRQRSETKELCNLLASEANVFNYVLEGLKKQNPKDADKIALAFVNGFRIVGEFDWPVYETAQQCEQARTEAQRQRTDPSGRLLRLIFEPPQ